jgi:multiple sugar transport system permease protein
LSILNFLFGIDLRFLIKPLGEKFLVTAKSSYSRPEALTAGLFLLPVLSLLGVFLLFPLLYVVYLSFTAGSFTVSGVRWVAGNNYQRLLSSPDFWQVVGNSSIFGLCTVLPTTIISLGLAVLLNLQGIGRGFWRTVYFLPAVTSLVAAGLGFRWLFQTDGVINVLLRSIGAPTIDWLSSPAWALLVVIILSVWQQIGFNLVTFLAGLQTIPTSRYEAAALDGANGWQQFWYITLPGLRSTLVLVIVTTGIFTLRSFEQIYVMTGGGPLNSTNLLAYHIYERAFGRFDFGYAAAATTLLLLVTSVLVYGQLRFWKS